MSEGSEVAGEASDVEIGARVEKKRKGMKALVRLDKMYTQTLLAPLHREGE